MGEAGNPGGMWAVADSSCCILCVPPGHALSPVSEGRGSCCQIQSVTSVAAPAGDHGGRPTQSCSQASVQPLPVGVSQAA